MCFVEARAARGRNVGSVSDRGVSDGGRVASRKTQKSGVIIVYVSKKEWSGPGSNRRHLHFQCSALPTELPNQMRDRSGDVKVRPRQLSIRSCKFGRDRLLWGGDLCSDCIAAGLKELLYASLRQTHSRRLTASVVRI